MSKFVDQSCAKSGEIVVENSDKVAWQVVEISNEEKIHGQK